MLAQLAFSKQLGDIMSRGKRQHLQSTALYLRQEQKVSAHAAEAYLQYNKMVVQIRCLINDSTCEE